MRWPLTRRHARRRTHEPATKARNGEVELVTIEAGQVTLSGPRDEVEHAVAVGLYGEAANAMPMSKDEDHVMTGVYIGVGLLLAAGAGYVAWRYLMSDEQKNALKDTLADGATKAKRVVRDAKGKLVA